MATKAETKVKVKTEQPCQQQQTSDSEQGEGEDELECAVCLQSCVHPVELPCNHVFCFLCVKGVAIQSKRCALCRQEIPADYFNHPNILREDDLYKDKGSEDGFQWYYEGRNGWWQYDERTSKDLEAHYRDEDTTFELLIAGFLYIIDLEMMVQIRRNDPSRRRRMKRDLITVEKKGVAGLKITSPSPRRVDRDGPEGGETDTPPRGGNPTGRKLPPTPTSRSTVASRYPGVAMPVTPNSAPSTHQGATLASPTDNSGVPDNIQALTNQMSRTSITATPARDSYIIAGVDHMGNVSPAATSTVRTPRGTGCHGNSTPSRHDNHGSGTSSHQSKRGNSMPSNQGSHGNDTSSNHVDPGNSVSRSPSSHGSNTSRSQTHHGNNTPRGVSNHGNRTPVRTGSRSMGHTSSAPDLANSTLTPVPVPQTEDDPLQGNAVHTTPSSDDNLQGDSHTAPPVGETRHDRTRHPMRTRSRGRPRSNSDS
eukprot:GHVU01200499.1.p1 GENE.GHVU01200499.1~~GHVU01200499.1.p1  ORF type:complete len:489 (+),score=23.88 GHVU01200499.1:28-1467(+)